LADITALRDHEWETRERGYHDKAVENINSLVRKYNGLAPYAVRRAYYMRSAELAKAYEDAGSDILRGIEERAGKHALEEVGIFEESEESGVAGVSPLRIQDVIREWLSMAWRRS